MNFTRKQALIAFSIIWSLYVSAQDSINVNTFSFELNAPIPTDPNVRIGQLENGIKYYIRYNKKPENRAELRLAVNAGSMMENDDQQGLAHFTEHMGFNGTKNFEKQELVDYLESVGTRFGPHLNAYTSFDETVYMFQIPTDSAEIIDKGFQILEDWAHGLSFEDEEIDKERGVVIEEWRLGKGANERMRNKYLPVLFYNSRYAERLPIGKKEILDDFKYETVRQFYKDWYRPDLMAVVAVGDFDVDLYEKKIKEHFSKIEAVKNPRERIEYEMPDHKDKTLVSISTDKEATGTMINVYYKHNDKEMKTVNDYRNAVVRRLYNGMINERLNELSQEADPPFSFAYTYYGNVVRTKDAYVSVARVKEDGIEKGLETILTENERVRKYGFTQTELERQKKEILRWLESSYKERDKTQSNRYVSGYVYHFLENNPIPGIEYQLALYNKFLPVIQLEEINALANEWITEHNNVVIITSPEKEGLTIPSEEEILKIMENAKQKEITAYVDNVNDSPLLPKQPNPKKVKEEKKIEELGITEWTLQNGVRVVLKPTDFKNDEIQFSAYSFGGSSLYPEKDDITASSVAGIVSECGVGDFNRIELGKKLSGKIVNVNPYSDELSEGFWGNSSPEDFETMLQLVYLYYTQPRIDSTAYLSYLAKQKTWIENRNARPENAFYDTISVTLSQNHFRRRPFSLAMLEEYDLQKAFKIYKERFADASDFTFFFVGNFDVQNIKPMIETYLGGLPSLNKKEMCKDMGIRSPKGVIEKTVKKGIEQKSRVSITFTGDFVWKDKQERFNMQSMLEVLSIKLRESLREDKGGVYGVSAYGSPSHYPIEKYSISISFGCDPEKLDTLVEAAFKEIKTLQDSGATAKDMHKIKETKIREREINLKENWFWMQVIEDSYYHNENPLDMLNFNMEVENLTSEDIQKAAQKYFDWNNYVKIILLPENQ